MNPRANLTIALALVAAALAIAQFAHVGPRLAALSPGLLVLIAALLGARYAVQRQKQKRDALLKAVPRRPLGIADDAPGDERGGD